VASEQDAGQMPSEQEAEEDADGVQQLGQVGLLQNRDLASERRTGVDARRRQGTPPDIVRIEPPRWSAFVLSPHERIRVPQR